jgi:hypothetical protein
MPQTVTSPSRLRLAASRVGLSIMVLVGLVLGLLISAVAFYLDVIFTFSPGPDPGTVAIVGVLIVLLAGLPAVALWRSSKRPVRRLAIGQCAGASLALLALVASGASTGFDPTRMTQTELHHQLSKMTATHRPAFYLGSEADGKRLAAITKVDSRLFFEYGRCLDNTDGDCDRPIEVTTQPMQTYGDVLVSPWDCKTLRPIRGVPSANLDGDPTIFTGSSIVSVAYWKKKGTTLYSQDAQAAALLNQLRPVATPTGTKVLPPPDTALRALVDRHCRPKT